MLDLWLNERLQPFFIGDKIAFLDKCLLSVSPPVAINRTPRRLNEFSTWKASELRSWLFYWSLPVLHGVLPAEYYIHYALLVVGCQLLCGVHVSKDGINHACHYFLKFYQTYELLYGIKATTMKLHILQRVPDVVERWGGLLAYSMFRYESLNGILKNFVHGTHFVDSQIASIVAIVRSIPYMLSSITEKTLTPSVARLTNKFGLATEYVYLGGVLILG
jgi:hypothetical protein